VNGGRDRSTSLSHPGAVGVGGGVRETGGGGGVGSSLVLTTPTPFPDETDFQNAPAEYKKEGTDWLALFNPKVKRVLDVSLVHTLEHERYVVLYVLPPRNDPVLLYW
jgi:hypothetical protein